MLCKAFQWWERPHHLLWEMLLSGSEVSWSVCLLPVNQTWCPKQMSFQVKQGLIDKPRYRHLISLSKTWDLQNGEGLRWDLWQGSRADEMEGAGWFGSVKVFVKAMLSNSMQLWGALHLHTCLYPIQSHGNKERDRRKCRRRHNKGKGQSTR